MRASRSPRVNVSFTLLSVKHFQQLCDCFDGTHTAAYTSVARAHKHHDLLTLGVIIFESGPSQVPHVAQLLIKLKEACSVI
jgi:hypothetical protein